MSQTNDRVPVIERMIRIFKIMDNDEFYDGHGTERPRK